MKMPYNRKLLVNQFELDAIRKNPPKNLVGEELEKWIEETFEVIVPFDKAD